MKLLLPLLTLSLVVLGLSGCVVPEGGMASNRSAYGETLYMDGLRVPAARSVGPSGPMDSVSYWDGDGVGGTPSVTIDLSEQKAFFYKSGKLVGVSKISSGDATHLTPTGTFKITQKNKNHRSNLYGDFVDQYDRPIVRDIAAKDTPPPGLRFLGSSMPNFMRFNGGVGMHAGFLPGYPASHGCVRMPERMSEIFFNNVSNGTVVRVVQ